MNYKTDSQHTLTLPVEISDRSQKILLKELESLLSEKPELVSLDCAHFDTISSSQIGLLWLVRQKCVEAGVDIMLLSPSSGLICVLKVLDLYDLFQYTPTRDFKATDQSADTISTSSYADEFRPEVESIDEALNNFVEFLNSLNLHHITVFELRTIFYEVSTNIRTHSGMSTNESILFTARTDDAKVVLVFADSGKQFDITKLPVELNPELAGKNKQRRGFGIALVRRLADKIEYIGERTGLNILLLEKRWN
jgi:anti-sigma regulatory factor (Ser/Thr protein kinase)/anti-anti-sigma regulatory factor